MPALHGDDMAGCQHEMHGHDDQINQFEEPTSNTTGNTYRGRNPSDKMKTNEIRCSKITVSDRITADNPAVTLLLQTVNDSRMETSNETRPDLANTTSERDIADTETTLSEPVLEANKIYEPAEENTAARCHPNRGRTSRKQ